MSVAPQPSAAEPSSKKLKPDVTNQKKEKEKEGSGRPAVDAPPPPGRNALAPQPRGKKSTVKEDEWHVLVEKAVLHPFFGAPRGQRSNLVNAWLDAVNTTLRAGEGAIPITEKVARKALEVALCRYTDNKEVPGCKEQDLKALCEAVAIAEEKKKKKLKKLKKVKLGQSVALVAEMSNAELEAFVDKRIEAVLAKKKAEKKKLLLKKTLKGSNSVGSSSSNDSNNESD